MTFHRQQNEPGFVYVAYSPKRKITKIGMSLRGVEKRIAMLKYGFSDIKLLFYTYVSKPERVEKCLLTFFKYKELEEYKEWFHLNDHDTEFLRELFSLIDER